MKRKSYPAYKPSGVEWLGDVPEHWEVERLKYAAKTIMGQSPSSDEYSEDSDLTPFLQGNADFSNRFPIPRVYCETANKIVPKESLLISVRAPVGAINEADQPYGIGRGLCAIIPHLQLSKDFVWYVLQVTKEELNLFATGSTYDAVSADNVGNMSFPLPSLPEQQAIADFLDRETGRIDILISKKQRLIELLKEKRTALISRAVTKGLDPTVPMKPSGVEWLGDVPEHWEVKRLKYQVSINDDTLPETTDPGYEMLYVDISSVDPTQGIVEKESLVFENAPSRARRIVRDGDTIVSTVRTYLRAISPVIEPEENLIVSTGFAVIRPRKMDKKYLYATIRTPYFIEEVVSRSVGVSYPAINASEIGFIPVPLPPLPEQRAIADFLDTETTKIDTLIAKVETAIEKLKEYRVAIISAAVTGKIDVREAV